MTQFLTNGKPIKKVLTTHEEWLANRIDGIGSSEIAVLMGCNKYTTPYQLWLNKRNARNGIFDEDNAGFLAMMGHKLEPIIAELFAEDTGYEIVDGSEAEYLYIHPDMDFLRASPDREWTHDGRHGILECKSTQNNIDADTIPPEWFCQVQWQMGIGQIEQTYISWLIRASDYGKVLVNFNPEFFALMVEKAEQFWKDCIIGGAEPELTNTEDVILKYQRSTEKEFVATEELYNVYSELVDVRRQRMEIDARESELKAQLQLNMLDCERLTYEGSTLATWKSAKDKQILDVSRLRKEHPDIFDKYCTSFDAEAFAKSEPELYAQMYNSKPGARTFRLK